jgi:hypothetical protein
MRFWSALAAVLMLIACDNYDAPNETIRGTRIWWNGQVDRRFEEVVRHCEHDLGVNFDGGGKIKFYPYDVKNEDAGLYYGFPYDVSLVQVSPCLDETSLCHELLHRQLGIDRKDVDDHHTRPEWAKLPYGKYCPGR